MRTTLFAIATVASMTQAVSIQQNLKEYCEGVLGPVTAHAEAAVDKIHEAIKATDNADRKADLEALKTQALWYLNGTFGEMEDSGANKWNKTKEQCQDKAILYIEFIDAVTANISRAGKPRPADDDEQFATVSNEE